jgi:hypothetical protein
MYTFSVALSIIIENLTSLFFHWAILKLLSALNHYTVTKPINLISSQFWDLEPYSQHFIIFVTYE